MRQKLTLDQRVLYGCRKWVRIERAAGALVDTPFRTFGEFVEAYGIHDIPVIVYIKQMDRRGYPTWLDEVDVLDL